MRIVVRALAVLALVLIGATAAVQFGLPWWMQAGDDNHVYVGEGSRVRYQVHVPPQYDGSRKLPVIMAIHGCAMTGYGWNSMKASTQLNRLADVEGFLVVYPTQQMFADRLNCWRSADARHQQRHSGEPAALAGVARQVVERYGADPEQVHVAGASSGAGTAVILAATYPDVFATVTSVAGGEYGLNQVDPDDPDATPPSYTARQAWAQMGERARRVPLLVVQGTDDGVVPPVVADRLVKHWSAVSDLIDNGRLDDSLGLVEQHTTVASVGGRHPYAHNVIRDAAGMTVSELLLVEGMGHAWSGPAADGLFTDRAGPDLSVAVWGFARRHPMRAGRVRRVRFHPRRAGQSG